VLLLLVLLFNLKMFKKVTLEKINKKIIIGNIWD